MATYSTYFMVLDDFPAGGTGAGMTYNVLGEANYEVITPANTVAVGDTIDGVEIVNLSFYHDSTSTTPYRVDFQNGSNILSTSNEENPGIITQFFELADGRVLWSMLSPSGSTSLFDEVSAQGSAVTALTFHASKDAGSGAWSVGASAAAITYGINSSTETPEYTHPPCFTAGTLIDTDQGQVPVEALKTGDIIKTKDHGFQPVRWVGESRVYDAPVRIKAGVFGNARDLVVSPRHRMLLQGWQMGLLFNHDEAFATAYDLKNGTTITVEPEGWVEYFHILLDRHEVIFAEGAETESFFPDEASLNSMAKATREELAAAVDLTTFGRTVRPTLTANQAMYLSHNMDLLEDTPNQIAAQ